jgi:lysozyme
MNLAELRESLIKHEGWRNTVYTCTAGKPTIGVGHCLERPISVLAINQILSDDINDCIAEMDRAFNGWRNHDDARQNVLLELLFNLGAPRLAEFKRMWAALQAKDYAQAASELLDSKWAKQVGNRAVTLAERMRTGKL